VEIVGLRPKVELPTVFVGGLVIGGADAPTPCDGPGWVKEGGLKLELKDCEVLGNGALLTFEPSKGRLPPMPLRACLLITSGVIFPQ
jgi:hypothetical protein